MKTLQNFEPAKAFLICVDSDGCAMDTMDIKHIRCFGPCMVEEWGLQSRQQEILDQWNQLNLYTMTRGINRFAGLAAALLQVHKAGCPIEGIEAFSAWVEQAKELSNKALKQAPLFEQNKCFQKALCWSQKVNEAIDALPQQEKKPFAFANEGLAAAHAFADVAVVSSANREAVEEEWQLSGLLAHVDVLCCQDAGSKAHIIEQLKAKGYAADHILMVGDAPGDQAAAKKNGVYYYPILVGHEAESWQELMNVGFKNLSDGRYAAYGEEKAQAFIQNLGGA